MVMTTTPTMIMVTTIQWLVAMDLTPMAIQLGHPQQAMTSSGPMGGSW